MSEQPLQPAPLGALVEAACEVMHDAYEAAALAAGWETQAASRKPWAEVPEANKATMRAAVGALLTWLRQPHHRHVHVSLDGSTTSSYPYPSLEPRLDEAADRDRLRAVIAAAYVDLLAGRVDEALAALRAAGGQP